MRIEGWEGRLAQYIADAKEIPFSWEAHNCAFWAAYWVKDCTGQDFVSDWIGQFASEEEAHTLMQSRGYSQVADIADAHLEIKPVMLAQRGDLVMHPITGGLGICSGRLSYFPGPEGLLETLTSECPRAWKVG